MSNLTASVYMDWGQPLRIFTGTIEPQAEQDSLNVPFFVSVRDFAVNVGSSTIKRWGSNTMPCPGSVRVNNAILTNKQEPHYHCTAVPFVELRKLTNNTDMHPQNKNRANAIIKWLEPIYKDYAEATLKPIETGVKALTPKFPEITAPDILGHAVIENREDGVHAHCSFNDTEQGQKAKELVEHTLTHEQKKLEYRKLHESGMSVPESLKAILGEPNQRQRDACESIAPVAFTVDDVAKRLYELKKENEDLKAEVEKLKKELEDYRTIRDMFLSIGGD